MLRVRFTHRTFVCLGLFAWGAGCPAEEAARRGPPAEVSLTFDNPEDRTLEGRFRITLPSGASISRFAMKIGGAWQEAEVVERQAARRAYEDFLHRRQDPALLEQQAGNEFTARVFPIPPRARKELIVSYSQALADLEAPYVIPLRGLPKLGHLGIRVLVGKQSKATASSSLGGTTSRHEIVEVEKREWIPDKDFEGAKWVWPNRLDGIQPGDAVLVYGHG